jgi:hypothetical protein
MRFVCNNKLVFLLFLLLSLNLFSQELPPAPVYPKTVAYVSIIHPIVTMDKDATTYNFTTAYTIGFPIGINLLKSDNIGFSFEIAPFIKSDKHSNKVSNILFHPGIMFRCKHGFTFVTRAAFETSGRYGVTPVFNKIVCRRPNSSYFLAASLPVRFGNDKTASIGGSFQIGINF